MTAAAILSAGRGTRFGSDVPKQFLNINGVPVLVRSVRAFLELDEISLCVVASGADCIDLTEKLLKKHFPDETRLRVITGGDTRGDTLVKILEYLKENCLLDDCILLTHDAVRPFVTKRIIEENISACRKYGACNTCVKTVDTVLHSADGRFLDCALSRSELYNAQTPQTFDAKTLYELISSLSREKFLSLTDGASVFLTAQRPVFIVRGEDFNIKITYRDDLKRGEQILAEHFAQSEEKPDTGRKNV